MELPNRKKLRLDGFDYSSENFYFVTICTYNKAKLFGEPERLNDLGKIAENDLISKTTSSLIKKGKNAILDTITTNIEEKFMQDVKSLELVSKYISNWKNYYNLKDLEGMEKEYKKIKKQMDTIMALDTTISEAKQIENVHNLIKNKGINYELSEEEKELINILK